MFENAKWIWPTSKYDEHEFAEFYTPLYCEKIENIKLRISSKTNYAVFCNGQEVGYGQYPDYPDEKVYDEWTLDAFLKEGENSIAIQAISFNKDYSSGIADGKGVIFFIESNGELLLASNKLVKGRISKTYQSGAFREFSPQLSYAFAYDFHGEDDWKNGNGADFSTCEEQAPSCRFAPRPIKRMEEKICEPKQMVGTSIYDFGMETVGLLGFEILAEDDAHLNVAFGEHLVDGCVRKIIHNRNFSVDFSLKKGVNVFQERFVRFGFRYLQLESDKKVEVRKIYVRETKYPVTVKGLNIAGRRAEIYNVGIHTLRCCMHDHYEDCPWREQAQYVMDSRTQMLCGYLAFGEYAFARACLKQMIHHFTKDGLLPITAPSYTDLAIPAFSLTYIVTLKEYVEHSGDKTLFEEVRDKVTTLLHTFIDRMKDGILPDFRSWNFYEWSDGLGNDVEIETPRAVDAERFSLPLNCFLIAALDAYAQLLGDEDALEYKKLADGLRIACKNRFYDVEKGEYFTYEEKGEVYHKAEYTQYLAMWSGVETDSASLCKRLTEKNDLVPITLASYIFKYEVLLQQGGYEEYLLNEIDRVWGYMLEQGATTFWETLKGEADFDGAGSLCHGWSAVPVYVYHKIANKTAL